MVLISLKSNNNDGFLYETTTSTKVDDLINELVEIHNARLLACLISDAVKELAMHGVMKRPEGYAARTDDDEEEEVGNICSLPRLFFNNALQSPRT